MLFIHPMWDHESQRLGKLKCTPTGYALHVVGEMIGFLGLLLLPGMVVLLILQWMDGSLRSAQLGLLAVPFCVGIVSEGLIQLSWWLARRKGFQYDYEHREASWLEERQRRTYRYPETPV